MVANYLVRMYQLGVQISQDCLTGPQSKEKRGRSGKWFDVACVANWRVWHENREERLLAARPPEKWRVPFGLPTQGERGAARSFRVGEARRRRSRGFHPAFFTALPGQGRMATRMIRRRFLGTAYLIPWLSGGTELVPQFDFGLPEPQLAERRRFIGHNVVQLAGTKAGFSGKLLPYSIPNRSITEGVPHRLTIISNVRNTVSTCREV